MAKKKVNEVVKETSNILEENKSSDVPMNLPEDIITAEDKKDFDHFDSMIYDGMESISKSGYAVAFALHSIYTKRLYRVDGYKNVYSYALERYGLSRTTCNDFINMVERFGKLSENKQECITEIKPEYELYGSSQLLAMKGHTDDEIKDAKINPSMSVREIKKAFKTLLPEEETEQAENGSSNSDKNSDKAVEACDSPVVGSRYFNLVGQVTHSIGLQDENLIAVIDKLLLSGHKVLIVDVLPEHENEFFLCNVSPCDSSPDASETGKEAPITGKDATKRRVSKKSPKSAKTA